MKKMNVLLAAFALAVAAVTPMTSSAISPTEQSPDTITLSRTYTSHYTLHIPDETLDLKEKSVDVDFGITGYLEFNKKLTVSVESENEWQLKDENHPENETAVGYKMKVGEKYITNEDNDVMSITYANNNNEIDTRLTFCEFEQAAYAGTYSDTLTFAVRSDVITPEEAAAMAATTTTTETNAPDEPVQETTTTEAAPET